MHQLKKCLLLLMSLVLLFAVAGCSVKEKKMSEKEQKAFVDEYLNLAMKPTEPKKIVKKMDSKLDQLNKDKSTQVIDGLLYAIYQYLPKENEKVEGLQTTLEEYEKDDINFNKKEDIEKIDDETLKAFLKEIKNRYMTVRKEGDQYVVRPNLGYILKKYEPYMSPALKEMVKFSKEEYETTVYNDKKETIDLDLVFERILRLEKDLDKYNEDYYVNAFKNSLNYYYQLYFSLNNDYLIDSNDKFKDDAIKHYRKVAKKYGDTTDIGKTVKKLLNKLEKSNYKLTDDIYVYLSDQANKYAVTKADDSTEENTNTTKGTANEKANKGVEKEAEKVEQNNGNSK